MNCQIKRDNRGQVTSVHAPNGKQSTLYQDILDSRFYDREQAVREWATVYTPGFKQWAGGDWESDKDAPFTDGNGEPLIERYATYTEKPPQFYYQLRSGEIEAADKQLNKMLADVLSKFGVEVQDIEDFKQRTGFDGLGATDVLNKLIYLSKDSKIDTMPEEAAHMIVMLMNKHPDMQYVLDHIESWDQYPAIKEQYLERYKGNEKQVKIEAAGQLISGAIVGKYRQTKGDPGLLKAALAAVNSFFQRLLEYFIKARADGDSSQMYANRYMADKIALNVLTGNTDYIASLKRPAPPVNFGNEMQRNPFAESIIKEMTMGRFNFEMTGSLAIAGQGEVIHRPVGQVHDLDFVVNDKSKLDDIKAWMEEKNAVPTHNGIVNKNKGYVTYSYLVPREGYQITDVKRERGGRIPKNDGYILRDKNSKEVLPSPHNVMTVDFFVYDEPSREKAQGIFSSWQDVYNGKMSLGPLGDNERLFNRDKDQQDYVRHVPKNRNVGLDQFTYLQKEQQSEKEPKADLDRRVRDFLASAGINVSTVDSLRDSEGKTLGAVARASMLSKIIEVASGRADITTLPEEAAHFFVEMLGTDSPLYKEMYAGITSYKIYRDTVAAYKDNKLYRNADGTINFDKLKKESMAKLIMAHMIKSETGDEVSSKISTAKTWWAKAWDYISKFFKRTAVNPFAQAGSRITSGDTTGLNTTGQLGTEEYLQAGAQGAPLSGIAKVLDDQQRLVLDDSVDPKTKEKRHIYNYDGKPIVGKDGEPRSVSSVYVDKWYKSRFPTDNRTERQKMIDSLKADEGTKIHQEFQDVIKRYFNPDGTRRDVPLSQKTVSTDAGIYDKVENYINQLLLQYPDRNTRFLSEVKIFDPKKNVAGTIDLLVVLPDGSVDIYDWKSQEIGKDQSELKWFKTPAYRIQLEEYKKILTTYYGFKIFNKVRAIPIRTTMLYTKTTQGYQLQKVKDIQIGDADPTKIPESMNYLLPVVMYNESTGNKNLDNLVHKLQSMYDILSGKQAKNSERNIKATELNDLTKTIRDLQVRKSISSFVERGLYDIDKYTGLLTKGAINTGNVAEAIDIMTVYAGSQTLLTEQLISLKKQIADPGIGPDEKTALQGQQDSFQDMGDNATAVLDKLKEKRRQLGVELAEGVGVHGLLRTEKALAFFERNMRSLSTLDTAALKTFYKVLSKAQDIRDAKTRSMYHDMEHIRKDLEAWGKANGKTGTAVFKDMLQTDTKGNWNGDFFNMYSPDYFVQRKKAIAAGDYTWLKANSDFDQAAYDAGRKEYEAMLEERYPGTAEKVVTKRAKELEKWEQEHSSKYEYAYVNRFNTYIKPKAKWYSDKYKFIHAKGNEPLLKAYTYFQDMNKEAARLGMIDKGSSKFIPSVIRGAEMNPKKILESLEVDSDSGFGKIDPLTGQLKKEKPVYFTRDMGMRMEDGSVDYSKKSTDLFKVFAMWGDQMHNYEAMDSIEDISEMLLEIEREKSRFVTNTYGKVSPDKETIEENRTNSKVLEDFINYYVYGQNTMSQSDKAIKIGDKEYSATKSAKEVLKLMSIKTLGLNYLSGTATFVSGMGNALFQASKRTLFTEGEWARGMKDIATRDKVSLAAIHQLGLSVEDIKGKHLRGLSMDGILKHADSEHLLFPQRIGDQGATFPVAAALLRTHMVGDDGKLVNIRDYVKSQNDYANFYNLPATERKAVQSKINREVTELQQTKSLKATASMQGDKVVIPGVTDNPENRNALRQTAHKSIKSMIGNASRDDINLVRTTLAGQTLMQFRSWMPQMMIERFGGLNFDADTETWNYGKARLLFQHMATKGFMPLLKDLATGFGTNTIERAKDKYREFLQQLYANGKIEDDAEFMTESEFIDMYLGNLRSMMRELIMLFGVGALLVWVSGGDDKSGFRKLMSKAFKKYYNEFAFYYNPTEFSQMLKSPVPILGLITDAGQFVGGTLGQAYGFAMSDEEAMKKYKPLKYLGRILPIFKEVQASYAMFDDQFAAEWGLR